jgi:hypothetical protein
MIGALLLDGALQQGNRNRSAFRLLSRAAAMVDSEIGGLSWQQL